MNKNGVVVIGGPTASGKSKLAIDLALQLNGEIINADSMQVYKDTPILSAVPDKKEKSLVKHHLFEIYESSVHGNVVDWLERCVQKIKEIREQGKMPIVVGGTGLYLKNLTEGTTPIPATPDDVREKIYADLKENSLEYMYEKLQKSDKKIAEKISKNDKTRILRALEVFAATGIKLSDWYEKPMIKKLPDAKFFAIKLIPNISELDEKCAIRFEQMLEEGALEEVRNLAAKNLDDSLPAMKALGVPELKAFIEGKISFEDAVFQSKLHTRQYAKRQLTWFKNQMKADFVINECYNGQKNLVDDIVKNHIKLLLN